MKPLLLAAVLAGVATPALAGGGCVGQVLSPPRESVRDERVLLAPGRTERVHVPAEMQRWRRPVLVRPERVERVVHPAVWRIERTYVTAPGPVRWERGPQRYAEVTERVLFAPGRYVWERRYGPTVSGPPLPEQTIVTPTGVVMCRVWRPAHYGTVVRRVRVGPGRPLAVRTTLHRAVVRRVLVSRAGVELRRTPAQYRWTEGVRLLAPGRWEVRRSPARYGWRQIREVHDGGSAYAPVVCGGPLSQPAMARMQSSLQAQGYDPGPADGIGRPQTYQALRRFQVDHRLAAGQVTVESARALGVIP